MKWQNEILHAKPYIHHVTWPSFRSAGKQFSIIIKTIFLISSFKLANIFFASSSMCAMLSCENIKKCMQNWYRASFFSWLFLIEPVLLLMGDRHCASNFWKLSTCFSIQSIRFLAVQSDWAMLATCHPTEQRFHSRLKVTWWALLDSIILNSFFSWCIIISMHAYMLLKPICEIR